MEGTAHFITEGEGKVCARASARPTKCGKGEVSMIEEGGEGGRGHSASVVSPPPAASRSFVRRRRRAPFVIRRKKDN